jgi:hypothetical protein
MLLQHCPICLCNMIEPITTRCSHTFCGECLSNWESTTSKVGTSCPLCRNLLVDPEQKAVLTRGTFGSSKSLFVLSRMMGI